jgi:hypothetical protein
MREYYLDVLNFRVGVKQGKNDPVTTAMTFASHYNEDCTL